MNVDLLQILDSFCFFFPTSPVLLGINDLYLPSWSRAISLYTAVTSTPKTITVPIRHNRCFDSSVVLLSLLNHLNRPLVLIPIEPAARVLANTLPPSMLRQARSRLGPHASLAVEDQRRILGRAGVAVHVFKVLVGDVEALDGRGDGDVDGAGDLAGVEELVGFADVLCFRGAHGQQLRYEMICFG